MLVTIDQVSNHSFDYIVIGGGTAGLVVAARLSEDPSVSVLVLEAGSPNLNDPAILTTARYGIHFGDPQYDWGFTTVPQTNANGKIAFWPRGKGLGGSSGINFFQYHLPSRADIDAFEKLGNKGWNWETLNPYFKKAERFLPPDVVKDDVTSFDVQEHGLEGPLEVSYPVLPSGLEKPFVEAAKALGINSVPEPLAGNTSGIWTTPVTIRPASRTRSYAANMYYEPNASRSNLSVLTSAHVARISLSKGSDGATAEGVMFIHDGKEYQALVNKTVVLSAGTILSPQVLELSGIGDPDVLRKADVGVVVDLPGVGNNIQEHVNSAVSYKIKEEFEESYVTFDCLMNPDGLQKQTELYRAGETTAFDMAVNLMSFVPLSTVTPEARALQDKYLASIRARIDSGDYPPGLRKQYEVQLDHIKAQIPSCEFMLVQARSVLRPVQDASGKYIAIGCLLNHPMSRGSIHIKSNDPLERPAIDPHYFEEEYDIRSLAETFKLCRRLVQQEPLKSILVEGELFPGPSVQTDEQIIENLKNNLVTTFHTVGSCSMLPREDGGVVDNKLKVYGTTNVHVIDLSIIPLHIGAHTQATVYAIGELGADIIKGRVNF
ncbi:alcohol oxidase [Lactarius pseudohatsudake]|nr:alcohol oxidase [Lactarius pseudohatsudake]